MEIINVDKRFLCKGDTFCFPISTFMNKYMTVANDVTVNFVLPVGVEYVSSNLSTGSYNSNTDVWFIDQLNSGQFAAGDFCFKVTDDCVLPYRFEVTFGQDSICFVESKEIKECYIVRAHTCCDVKNCDFEPITVITSNYTATLNDRTIIIDATDEDIVVTLPEPSETFNSDKQGGITYNFKVRDLTNTAKIVTPSGKIVNYSTVADAYSDFEFTLVGQAIAIQSDGENYNVKPGT